MGGGNCFDDTFLKQNLIAGKTTKAEVEKLCGSPTSSRSGASPLYQYDSTKMGLQGMLGTFGSTISSAIPGVGGSLEAAEKATDITSSRKNLTVYFYNANGTVSGYSLNK
ncbi:hypothetical protein ACWA5Z_11345 [Testudinibacter sp. P80/BLE/0925]|uniref:hypothetical protein n=1 Tax=Testudinibacter sp. TW-1 TaxID=3417757 RepID=UPI003D35F778